MRGDLDRGLAHGVGDLRQRMGVRLDEENTGLGPLAAHVQREGQRCRATAHDEHIVAARRPVVARKLAPDASGQSLSCCRVELRKLRSHVHSYAFPRGVTTVATLHAVTAPSARKRTTAASSAPAGRGEFRRLSPRWWPENSKPLRPPFSRMPTMARTTAAALVVSWPILRVAWRWARPRRLVA